VEDDGRDGPKEDADVEPKRPLLDVVEIEADHVIERKMVASPNLP
jgi:hypothetical protein